MWFSIAVASFSMVLFLHFYFVLHFYLIVFHTFAITYLKFFVERGRVDTNVAVIPVISSESPFCACHCSSH